MTKKKRVIVLIVLLCLLTGAGAGGFLAYRSMNNVVSVYPVTMLKSDWENSNDGNVGVVGNNMTQKIVPEDGMEIEKIYVEAGQEVKIGDKILDYNAEEKKIDLELKEYDVKELEFSIGRVEKNLENLKKGIVTDSFAYYGIAEKKVPFLTSLYFRTLDTPDTDIQDGQEVDDPGYDDYEDDTYETEYSWAQIQQMIKAQETELAELELKLKEAQFEYNSLKKEVDDATVTAVIDGFVKDINAAASGGDTAVTIVSEKNLSIKGTIDEFYYHKVEVGMTVTAVSWETGRTCKAKITELSSYPVSSLYTTGSGNPNVSYYPFTAVIDESYTEISAGESVTMSFEQNTVTESAGSIYLPIAYVRTDNHTSYVYIRGAGGRLKKQTVETGQSFYNMVVEVKSGIGYEDYVAFPYGKNVKEGARTVISEDDSEIIY